MSNQISVKDKVAYLRRGQYSYQYMVNHALIEEYKTWCKTNVGANNWNYFGEYRKNPFEFRFKNSEDLLAFRLRFMV